MREADRRPRGFSPPGFRALVFLGPCMEFDLWYLIFVPVLFAAGWWSRGLDQRQRTESSQLPENFSRGLSLLLSDEPDRAIDAFVEVVKIDPEQTELQHSLGDLFRQRGDFERAIRLHNHLYSRADLPEADRLRSLRELARDYFDAGCFDRAEAAYKKLSESPSEHLAALRRLLTIYSIEHEWESAIDTAHALEVRAGEDHGAEIAHFYCELVERALRGKSGLAGEFMQKALERGDATPRAGILAGELARASGDPAAALAHWRRVLEHSPAHLPLVAGPMADAMDALGDRAGALAFLKTAIEENRTVDTMEAVLERIARWEGLEAAGLMAQRMLEEHPSLSSFKAFLGLRARANPGDEHEKLLAGLLERHARRSARYQCVRCGFLASNFSWHCLGCGSWDSFPPKRIEDVKAKN